VSDGGVHTTNGMSSGKHIAGSEHQPPFELSKH